MTQNELMKVPIVKALKNDPNRKPEAYCIEEFRSLEETDFKDEKGKKLLLKWTKIRE